MKKIYIIGLCLLSLQNMCYSQDQSENNKADTVDGWKKGGLISINFSQSAFVNWTTGGGY